MFLDLRIAGAAKAVSCLLVGASWKMHPVEDPITTACHSGLGGPGDLEISSPNCMGLMPLAQMSTRIGSAEMVVSRG
ncbi:2-hydroxycarboxylate transporter family protein [Caballeronia sp. NCF4]|uniref:2-hydroxycarboxylate transporter family protein n=1 Tax=Caballeronia sp. NCF4 TaxID=2921758 RepID=UPI003305CC70